MFQPCQRSLQLLTWRYSLSPPLLVFVADVLPASPQMPALTTTHDRRRRREYGAHAVHLCYALLVMISTRDGRTETLLREAVAVECLFYELFLLLFLCLLFLLCCETHLCSLC